MEYSERLRNRLSRMARHGDYVAEKLTQPWSVKDDKFRFNDISEDSSAFITYITESRWERMRSEAYAYEDVWESEKRQSMKVARWARAILRDEVVGFLTDKDFEQFNNAFIGEDDGDGTFMLVEGDQITRWYDGRNYGPDYLTGSLGSSCMRYSECGPYMGIYEQNVGKVSMLVYVEDGELYGRALVWHDVEVAEYTPNEHDRYAEGTWGEWEPLGAPFMDRIYGDDAMRQRFISEARTRGYWRKAEQSYRNAGAIKGPDGEVREATMRVRIPHAKLRAYPYMDTFMYLNPREGVVQNALIAGQGTGWHTLHSTSGYSNLEVTPRRLRCVECGSMAQVDDMDLLERVVLDGERYRCDNHESCPRCARVFPLGESCRHCVRCTQTGCDNYTDRYAPEVNGQRVCEDCYNMHGSCVICNRRNVGRLDEPWLGAQTGDHRCCDACASLYLRDWAEAGEERRARFLNHAGIDMSYGRYDENYDWVVTRGLDACPCGYCTDMRARFDTMIEPLILNYLANIPAGV